MGWWFLSWDIITLARSCTTLYTPTFNNDLTMTKPHCFLKMLRWNKIFLYTLVWWVPTHVTFSCAFVSPTYQYLCGSAHTVWSSPLLINWAKSRWTTTAHKKEVFQTSAHRTVVCTKPTTMLFQSIFPGRDPSRHSASFFFVLSFPYMSDHINQRGDVIHSLEIKWNKQHLV